MFRALPLVSLLLALPAAAQGTPPTSPPAETPPESSAPPPFPATLEEAARLADPDAPPAPPTEPMLPPNVPPPGTSAPPTPPSEPEEPKEVDGWTILSLLSERRGIDGKPTKDACGYEREVVAERTVQGRLQTTHATLVVPCEKGPAGLVAGKPALKLPPGIGAPTLRLDNAQGLVELGVIGALDPQAVRTALQQHEAAIGACHTTGKGGRLVVRFVVGPEGRVTEAAGTEGPFKGTAVDACVAGALKAISFARPTDGRPAVVSATWSFPDHVGKTAPTPPAGPPRCKEGEKPKKPEELKPGEVACIEATPPAEQRPCELGEQPKAKDQLGPGEQPCKEIAHDRGVPFYKGELSHLGDVQLVNARNSVGVGLGVNAIDDVYFAVVRPDINLKFGKFRLGLGAPLRFEVADLSGVNIFAGDPIDDAFGNAGRFRTEDWDQVEDFLRPIRYLTYGRKEDTLYVNLNRVNAITIGHGQLVRRYSPNVDIDEDNLFATFDHYGAWGGVELMSGPFPMPRIIGGLAFVRPLGIAQTFAPIEPDGTYLHMLLDSWSLGVSYVTDLNSPTGLEGRFNPADQRFQLSVDAANQLVWRNKQNPVGDVVQGLGFDTELKVLKLDHVDIKVYGDYSHLFFPADTSSAQAFDTFSGGGAAVGGLVRVSFGETPVRPIEQEDEETKAGRKPRDKKAAHAFRFRLEGRTFAPTYLPSYWNTLYEVDRFQFGSRSATATLPKTKIGFLAGKQGDPWRVGYYLEASYAWIDALAVTAVLEDAYPLGADDTLQAKNVALHVETAGLGWLQLFASYHYRNFETSQFDKLLSFSTDNELLYGGLRLQLMPILFVNVAVQRAFRVGFAADDTDVVDSNGLRFSSIGLQNSWASGFDVELGWQF